MAFLTTRRASGVVDVKSAFEIAMNIAIQIKAQATIARDAAANASLTSRHIIDGLMPLLVNGRNQLLAVQNVAGVGSYAAEQFSDVPGYNIGTEFSAMMTAITNTAVFFRDNWPKDADGNLKHLSFDTNAVLVPFSGFTAPQRAAVVTQLNALLATID